MHSVMQHTEGSGTDSLDLAFDCKCFMQSEDW